jgi:hypothetical protein
MPQPIRSQLQQIQSVLIRIFLRLYEEAQLKLC